MKFALSMIFLAAFIVTSVIHLKDSWKQDQEKRAKTKPFLLIFLLVFYLLSAKNISIFLSIALFASWLGDVLLIPKGNKWFTLGGIAFAISHLFFILTYIPGIDFSKVPWVQIVLLAVIYYGISFFIIRMLKDSVPKMMKVPMYLYLLCNSTMNLFAYMQMHAAWAPGAVIAYIGAVFFFISDTTLFLVRYYKDPNLIFKRHFTVMLTYLIGEFMIAFGISMLGMF